MADNIIRKPDLRCCRLIPIILSPEKEYPENQLITINLYWLQRENNLVQTTIDAIERMRFIFSIVLIVVIFFQK